MTTKEWLIICVLFVCGGSCIGFGIGARYSAKLQEKAKEALTDERNKCYDISNALVDVVWDSPLEEIKEGRSKYPKPPKFKHD